MLNEQTLKQTEYLTDALSYSNRTLSVVPNSPVSNLVNTLKGLEETGSHDELIDQSVNPASSTGTHCEVEGYTAKQIAKIMGNIINVAKNVVNPHCRAIVEGIAEQRKENVLRQVGLLGTIKQIDIPAVLVDDMFLEFIGPYRDTPAATFNNAGDLFRRINEDFTSEEKMVLIKTGSPLLDSRIEACLGSNIVFDYPAYEFDIARLQVKDCVLLFLLLTGLQHEKLDKAAAIMSDSATALVVSQLRSAAGGQIYRAAKLYDESIARGEIVAREDFFSDYNDPNVLTVWGANYRDWIQNKGGSPEAALGFLSERGGRFTLAGDSELRDHPEVFLNKYTLRMEQAKSKSILEDINLVRSYTGRYMADAISRMEDVNRAELQSKLTEALEHEYHGAAALNTYVIKVVSRTLTEGTSVKDILLEVDSILAGQAEPDMAYAVYIASFRLIARWLREQLILEPK